MAEPVPTASPDADLVWVPGGDFTMGSDRHYPEEAPAHCETVAGLWVERHAVTNARFAAFVAATGHVTVAERAPRAEDYPAADPDLLVPASLVFVAPRRAVDLADQLAWWALVPGTDWRHPRGPNSSLDGLDDHPVVHVAHADAAAYAAWAGRRLPTEAEWERAARGGLNGAEFAWGDEWRPTGVYMANTWQGPFPYRNALLDGHEWTAPVGAFPPNGYGLHEMTGNTWEWTDTPYRETHAPAPTPTPACCGGGSPRAGGGIERKVMKGGSHLCAPNYCRRYRPAARMPQDVDTSTSHLGFRCVL